MLGCEKMHPFLKWPGGKRWLVSRHPHLFPKEYNIYYEPFLGGGSVFFHLMPKNAFISDINQDLINTYRVMAKHPDRLRALLEEHQKNHCANHYYEVRDDTPDEELSRAARFLYLNRTCFNGLYRVNGKNLFNVPFGKYVNPKICDEENLRNNNQLLQKVEILNGDYSATLDYLSDRTFYYLDPPYKPISKTSCFNSYSSISFDDKQQIRLKGFCDTINEHNGKLMLSNSDPKSVDETNTFFDDLYGAYNIHRVLAKRNINAKGDKRGKIKELLITNY